LSVGCAAAAVLLIGAAYWQKAFWWVGLLLAIVYAAWFLLQKRRLAWLNTTVFLAGLAAGAFAIHLGASPYLAIAGVVFAAAAWEIADGSGEAEPGSESAFEKKRLLLLGLTLGSGLALSAAGLLVSARLPFFVLLLAIIVILFCLFRFFQLIQRKD
jgi:hypothetical protein